MPDPRTNCVPRDFRLRADLSVGFLEFILPLHREFTPRQQQLVRRREAVLTAAHHGDLPPQAGLLEDKDALMSASRFDVAMIFYKADPAELKHPLLRGG